MSSASTTSASAPHAKKEAHAASGGKKPAASLTSPSSKAAAAKKGSGEKSRARRAGLTFPVGRIHRQLKTGGHAKRVGSHAPIFLAAVLEYLTAEILEISANNSRDDSRVRIVPRNIMFAIRNDEELHKLLSNVTIANAGVISCINPYLLLKSGAAKKAAAANATLDDVV